MARSSINLSAMDVDALLVLRSDIDNKLTEKRRELEKALARLGAASGQSDGRAAGKTRTSPMKNCKVAPKYRSPGGETWAGRGVRPRWLAALIKQGRKIEEFAIDKAAAAGKPTGRRKYTRRKPR
jgi:DNA-binding protein H-NS